MANLASGPWELIKAEASWLMKTSRPLGASIMFVISHVIVISWLLFIYFMILSLFILTFIVQPFLFSTVLVSILPVQLLSPLFARSLQLRALG